MGAPEAINSPQRSETTEAFLTLETKRRAALRFVGVISEGPPPSTREHLFLLFRHPEETSPRLYIFCLGKGATRHGQGLFQRGVQRSKGKREAPFPEADTPFPQNAPAKDSGTNNSQVSSQTAFSAPGARPSPPGPLRAYPLPHPHPPRSGRLAPLCRSQAGSRHSANADLARKLLARSEEASAGLLGSAAQLPGSAPIFLPAHARCHGAPSGLFFASFSGFKLTEPVSTRPSQPLR